MRDYTWCKVERVLGRHSWWGFVAVVGSVYIAAGAGLLWWLLPSPYDTGVVVVAGLFWLYFIADVVVKWWKDRKRYNDWVRRGCPRG